MIPKGFGSEEYGAFWLTDRHPSINIARMQ